MPDGYAFPSLERRGDLSRSTGVGMAAASRRAVGRRSAVSGVCGQPDVERRPLEPAPLEPIVRYRKEG